MTERRIPIVLILTGEHAEEAADISDELLVDDLIVRHLPKGAGVDLGEATVLRDEIEHLRAEAHRRAALAEKEGE